MSVPDGLGLSPTGEIYYERSKILIGENSRLNELIREITATGGEVRSITKISKGFLPSRKTEDLSYFKVADEGRPILVLEKGADERTISHEMQHFRDWLKIRDNFIQSGLDLATAQRKAKSYFGSRNPELRVQLEHNAVAAELNVSGLSLMHPDLLRRLVYPEVAAIQTMFNVAEVERRPFAPAMMARLNKLMDTAIERAINLRALRSLYLKTELERITGVSQRTRLEKELQSLQDVTTLPTEMDLIRIPKVHELFNVRFARLR